LASMAASASTSRMIRGSYTITRIEAQFKIAESLVAHRGYRRLPDFDTLPDGLRAGWGLARGSDVRGADTMGRRHPLRERRHPRPAPGRRIPDRAVDRPVGRARWEHKRGVVPQIRDDEPWNP
jgi:hypothetical protein